MGLRSECNALLEELAVAHMGMQFLAAACMVNGDINAAYELQEAASHVETILARIGGLAVRVHRLGGLEVLD